MTRTKLASTADWLGSGLVDQLRDLSRLLGPKLSALEKRSDLRLKQAGFEKAWREPLMQVSLFAAARILLQPQPLTRFFENVETVGRQLARLNVKPADVTRALQISNELIDSVVADSDYGWAREQFTFCTILALNHAYYEVREAEAHALYELFHIEVESSNVDVLFRRFIEAMAENCGAAAGHIFLLSEDETYWQLKASTAKAASSKTMAVLPVRTATRRALSKPQRIAKPELILDAGWTRRFPCIWSVPIAKGSVLQFGFASERDMLPREIEMLLAAGDRCHAAAQKTKLLEDIASREEQLSKLAIRMLMVEENERRRISRELHDDAGQSLVVIRLQMEMIEQSLPPESEARERLSEARDITEKTILDMRRLIADLSPSVLEQLGLGAALRQLVKRFSAQYPCDARLNVRDLPPMDTNFQMVIYRLAQECFNNIAQHSEATAVNISVSVADRVLRLHVEDNGNGFHVEEALSSKNSFGLVGLRERVAILGGNVSITSTRKEGVKRYPRKKPGTVIVIELPIP